MKYRCYSHDMQASCFTSYLWYQCSKTIIYKTFSRKIKAIFPPPSLTPCHSTDSEVHIKFMYINCPTTQRIPTSQLFVTKKYCFLSEFWKLQSYHNRNRQHKKAEEIILISRCRIWVKVNIYWSRWMWKERKSVGTSKLSPNLLFIANALHAHKNLY